MVGWPTKHSAKPKAPGPAPYGSSPINNWAMLHGTAPHYILPGRIANDVPLIRTFEGITTLEQFTKCLHYGPYTFLKVTKESKADVGQPRTDRVIAFSREKSKHKVRKGLAFTKEDNWFCQGFKARDFLFGTPTILGREVCFCSSWAINN